MSTIINAFTYTHATKPIISEFPFTKVDAFKAFKRAIRVKTASGYIREQDMDRDIGMNVDVYLLELRTRINQVDLENIVEDIRAGCRSYAPSSTYSVIQCGEAEYAPEGRAYTAKMVIQGTMSGGF